MEKKKEECVHWQKMDIWYQGFLFTCVYDYRKGQVWVEGVVPRDYHRVYRRNVAWEDRVLEKFKTELRSRIRYARPVIL